MKFSQLQIGQRFRYRGTTYRKASPLMAVAEGEEKQQLIPRSAGIQALDTPPPASKPATPTEIPVAQLDRAMAQLANEINTIISESGMNAGEASGLLRQLQAAFLKTRRNLNLP